MSVESQKRNMRAIYNLASKDLGYIYVDGEGGRPAGAKKEFHNKSKAFLRALGKDLGLCAMSVESNRGGIAVSGEIKLMGIWDDGNGLYFQLSEPISGAFMYRSIKHMEDYTGGLNQWLPMSMFKHADYEGLLGILSRLCERGGVVECAS